MQGFWNESCLDKELVLKRRDNHVYNNIVQDVLAEIMKTKKGCSIEQAGRCLVAIYSTNSVDMEVIRGICNKIHVIPGLAKLMESKIEDTSFGYMAQELSFLWRLYQGLKYLHGTSFHIRQVYFQGCHMMYLLDRLTLLTAVWRKNDHMFCMKSVLTEWLISEKPNSHQDFVGIPYNTLLTDGLKEINCFMIYLIKYFTVESMKNIDSLIFYSKETVEKSTFVKWLVFTLCFLNLNNQVSDDTVQEILSSILISDNVSDWLPPEIYVLLTEGFIEDTSFEKKVRSISNGLKMLDNQLIMIELKEDCESTIKIPSSAVLVNYQTWENQHRIFQLLFAEDDGKKKKKEKEKKKVGVAKQLNEKVIQWESMKTDFFK